MHSADDMSSDTPKYEKRYLAFIDILGWSDLVRRSEENGAGAAFLADILRTLRQVYGNEFREPGPVDFQTTLFSDCIVTSCPEFTEFNGEKVDSAFFITNHILSISRNLIFLSGTACRGAITFGNILHTEDVVVGPALIRACELEQSHAIFPRTIIDPNCIDRFSHLMHNADIIGDQLVFDPDGMMFVNFLGPAYVADAMGYAPLLRQTDEALNIWFQVHRGNPHIYAKYHWLKRYLTACSTEYFNNKK